jgi:hypothetical protein
MIKSLISGLLLLPCTLVGQTGGIRGQVTDARSGEALVGANVVVVGSKPGHGAASDMNGMYLIHKLPPGEYVLRVSYLDYQTITLQNVKVNASQTTEANVAMRKEGDTEPVASAAVDTFAVRKDTTKGLPATGTVRQ